MDTVYDEVNELAHVFGVPERGEKLVGDLRARVEKAKKGVDASDASLLYWFSDSKAPISRAVAAPGVITNELGAKNVFDDTTRNGRRSAGDRRRPQPRRPGHRRPHPDHADRRERAKKIEFLESNPVTRTMDAVKKRPLRAPQRTGHEPHHPTVEGLELVAAGLRDFGFTE